MVIYVRDENGVLQPLNFPAYKGEKGEAGVTPSLQIGDVVTLESGQQATVVRRGDDENPIFDFAIPKGEDGENGIFVGSVNDAPDYAQIVVNDDPSPYDLFYEDANVSYMGDTYTSLKEKADADIEYLLRKFATQHYEGTNIVATDTYMKRVNSAMFKGRTLVNLAPKIEDSVTSNYQSGNVEFTLEFKPLTNLKSNTKYTVLFKASNVINATNGMYQYQGRDNNGVFFKYNIGLYTIVNGYNKLTFTSPIEITKIQFLSYNTFSVGGGCRIHGDSIMIVEGDCTNQDIPYFEGMRSVKAPTVKMVGKNLAPINDIEDIQHGIDDTISRKVFDISLKPNTKYSIKTDAMSPGMDKNRIRIYSYGKNGTYKLIVDYFTKEGKALTFTTPNESLDYFVTAHNFDKNFTTITSLQIEEGTTATAYEPYKSKAITLDGEYRGIGDVCDTVDLITGEKVEHVGDITLNSSENWRTGGWANQTDTIGFETQIGNAKNSRIFKGMSDKLSYTDNFNLDKECFTVVATVHGEILVGIRILRSKLSSEDVSGLDKYLNENPITIQYELETPVIKTVDLKGQKIYSYDGTTHYTTASAQGHPAPILSIDVPTNTTKMIARQREEIEQQEQKLQEQEEIQNVLIESQLAWYEQTLSTLELSDQRQAPGYIQKLYELSRKNKAEEE